MKLFKQIKRKSLIRLMTVLGFGGMAAFCIASCQPEKKYGPPPVRDDIEQEMQESSAPNANGAAAANGEDATPQPAQTAPPAPMPVRRIAAKYGPRPKPRQDSTNLPQPSSDNKDNKKSKPVIVY